MLRVQVPLGITRRPLDISRQLYGACWRRGIFSEASQLQSPKEWIPLPRLPSASLQDFVELAFQPSKPCLLPKSLFRSLPAVEKWFAQGSAPSYNVDYLDKWGDILLPTEYSSVFRPPAGSTGGSSAEHVTSFHRASAPFSLFLAYSALKTSGDGVPNSGARQEDNRLTIAQAPLSLLPAPMLADVPVPELVLKAGTGSIYDSSSFWLGVGATATPLHRDPNPNLLVQLCGRKKVRMLKPDVGEVVLANARGKAGKSWVRGEEMMSGAERDFLEAWVWDGEDKGASTVGWEGSIEAGDAVFIPTGWWHAIRGVGEGATASVNWWFR